MGGRSVEVSEEVYELLSAIAKSKEKNVDVVILECIVKEIDPGTRIEVYMKLHEKYLRDPEELYGKGDLPKQVRNIGAPLQPSSTPSGRRGVGATTPIGTTLKS